MYAICKYCSVLYEGLMNLLQIFLSASIKIPHGHQKPVYTPASQFHQTVHFKHMQCFCLSTYASIKIPLQHPMS